MGRLSYRPCDTGVSARWRSARPTTAVSCASCAAFMIWMEDEEESSIYEFRGTSGFLLHRSQSNAKMRRTVTFEGQPASPAEDDQERALIGQP